MDIKINGRLVDDYVKVWYELNLSEKNRAEIHFNNQTEVDKSLKQIGNKVEIFYEDKKKFMGRVKSRNQLPSGGLSLRCVGEEFYQYSTIEFNPNEINNADEEGVFKDTEINQIYEDLLNQGANWSSPNISVESSSFTFRGIRSESIWNNLKRLAYDWGHELKPNYEEEHLGVSRDIGDSKNITLTEYQDISPVDYEEREAEGKKIIVYGKGKGDNQVIGEAESEDYSLGEPVKKITDKRIETEKEAKQRAKSELDVSKLTGKEYNFKVYDSNGLGRDLDVGDSFILDAPSTGVDKDAVRVIQIRRGTELGRDFLRLRVTNLDYSKTRRSLEEELNELSRKRRDSDTTEDGSSNTTEWGNSINANNEFPLRTVFFIPRRKIKDRTDRNVVKSFTLDYEVEPFKESAGTASEDNTEPPLVDSLTSPHNHDVIDFGHDHDTPEETSDQDDITTDLSTYNSGVTSGYNIRTVDVPFVSGGRAFIIASFYLSVNREGASFSDGGYRVTIRSGGIIRFQRSNLCSNYENWTMSFALPPDEAVSMEIEDESNNQWSYAYGITACAVSRHQHDIPPSFTDDNSSDLDELDQDPDVTGFAEAHNHNVEIGTGLGESADINTNGVDIYLDYWDESNEQWIEKTSDSRPHNTVAREIDLSNGGQYPDEAGFWRVRIYTRDSEPDYVQNVVNLEHYLDD